MSLAKTVYIREKKNFFTQNLSNSLFFQKILTSEKKLKMDIFAGHSTGELKIFFKKLVFFSKLIESLKTENLELKKKLIEQVSYSLKEKPRLENEIQLLTSENLELKKKLSEQVSTSLQMKLPITIVGNLSEEVSNGSTPELKNLEANENEKYFRKIAVCRGKKKANIERVHIENLNSLNLNVDEEFKQAVDKIKKFCKNYFKAKYKLNVTMHDKHLTKYGIYVRFTDSDSRKKSFIAKYIKEENFVLIGELI